MESEAPAPSSIGPGFVARYRAAFAIDEIESSVLLQRFMLVILVGFLMTLLDWYNEPWLTVQAIEGNRFRCWPYFLGCSDWYVLAEPRAGFSQTLLFAVLFGVLLAAAAAAVRGRYVLAHALAMVLVVWKLLVYFVFSSMFATNYHYFHLVFSIVFLTAAYKTFFLRHMLVVLYFLAASLKLHEGWALGTYFSSMHLGLPLVPDALIPLASNAAILLETVGSPLLLLSSRPRLARGVFWAFVAFHLYSIAIVGIAFSITCLLPLVALFGPRVAVIESPFDRRSIAGWALIGAVFAIQSIGLFIPGDSRMTGEGASYGLSMFDANHQCQWDITIDNGRGQPRHIHNETTQSRKRCDPYREWFWIHTVCRKGSTPRIAWTYDHSINGGPLVRIVDEADACRLEYRAFGHNAWIRTPDQGASVIGYPVKNVFD